MTRKRKLLLSLLYVFFVLSGMTGLVYQVLWSRKLSIIFGHTVFAVSSILAAFMGGLALGSFLAGKLVDKLDLPDNQKPGILMALSRGAFSSHVRLYGLLELGIGIYALFTPFLINLVGGIYIALMGAFSLSLYPMSVITFILSVAIFILPTMAMGATLPIVLKFVIRTYGELMEKTAWIYAINTFGAVIGSFLAGFILFPALGLQLTLAAAAVINVIIGIIAIFVDRSMAGNEEKPEATKSTQKQEAAEPAPVEQIPQIDEKARHRLILLVFFISGFTSMVYEVGWSRALALSIGSSVYSFSTILVTFLFGIALGSYLFSKSRFFNQDKISIRSLANVELAIAVLSLVILPVLGFLPYIFLKMFPILKNSYFLVVAGNFIISFLVILPPTILFGVTFPMVVKIYTRDLSNLGTNIGVVYASNTAGNILGSFMTGFLLIPLMGVENSLKFAIALNLLGALMIYLHLFKKEEKKAAGYFRFALIALMVVVLVFFQAWRKSAMSLGVSVYARFYSQVKNFSQFNKLLEREAKNIVFYRDGISCTVTIMKTGDLTALKVNGKNDASYSPGGTEDMHTQWLQGFIPSTLHHNPRRVCVIGFGSGITDAAVSQFDEVKRIDSVEIEPVVMQAARYFREGNLAVMENPKFHSHIADGRNFILASKQKYDLIISEPSNPWIAGIGNLFSVDFYQVCLRKLNDDGIYCQWIHTYGMAPDTVRMVMKTFYSVFPHGSLWITQRGDLMLIGCKKPVKLDYRRLKEVISRNPRVKKYLQMISYDDPRKLLANYVADADRIRAYARDGRINSDDKPLLEFDAPKNIYGNIDRMLVVRQVARYGHEISKLDWVENLDPGMKTDGSVFRDMGKVYARLELWDQARQSFRHSISLDPGDSKTYLAFAGMELKTDNPLVALSILKQANNVKPDNQETYLEAIKLYKSTGALWEGIQYCKAAIKALPENRAILRQLVVLMLMNESYKEALPYGQELVRQEPRIIPYHIYLGRIYMETGEVDKAGKIFKWVLKIQPDNFVAQVYLGDVYKKKNMLDDAVKAYGRAIKLNPRDVVTPLKMAKALEKLGKPEEARSVYQYVLNRDPENVAARVGIIRSAPTAPPDSDTRQP